jgi:hypothetical protein
MSDPIPVAGNLLESKFLGMSIRRLGESMALPIAPCVLGYTLGVPLLITVPLFVVGIGIGALMYVKTPPGQRPLRYAHAVIRHRTSGNVYVWAPSTTLDETLTAGARQNDWLTRPPSGRSPSPDTRFRDGGRDERPGRTPAPVQRAAGHDEEAL